MGFNFSNKINLCHRCNVRLDGYSIGPYPNWAYLCHKCAIDTQYEHGLDEIMKDKMLILRGLEEPIWANLWDFPHPKRTQRRFTDKNKRLRKLVGIRRSKLQEMIHHDN